MIVADLMVPVISTVALAHDEDAILRINRNHLFISIEFQNMNVCVIETETTDVKDPSITCFSTFCLITFKILMIAMKACYFCLN